MIDRTVSILHAYEFTVMGASRGRGAVLCDTDQGMKILKEYSGSERRLELQEKLLSGIRTRAQVKVEQLVRNRNGELITKDSDQTGYIVKDYFPGRECNRKDSEECALAVRTLARLHLAMEDMQLIMEDTRPVMQDAQPVMEDARPVMQDTRPVMKDAQAVMQHTQAAWEPLLRAPSLSEEFARHNRELKRVYKYIRQKGRKNAFERFLYQHYEEFLGQALRIEAKLARKQKNWRPAAGLCHGDYQYHNLLYEDGQFAVINFERFCLDSQMRDLYLFLRKLLEKNNWPFAYGMELLHLYGQLRPFTQQDKEQLYYRFAYPEKFWKIVNFYYNSGKAWIPDKNQEKLEKLLEQEEAHRRFVEGLLRL